MWQPDKLYKHVNNTTVAIEVVKKEQLNNGDWKLLVLWYNIGKCHKPWYIGEMQTITVPNTRLPEWKEYNHVAD